ncbi:periplasmically oriented, membrane-bound formate dehydrogenase, b-type cytochrome subunit [Desulfuromonas sp. DDH964]|uniref:polysulfide reductase n=1 Tax=Desulfuromonas sp. DDH964 TaxID=1823759 RepID=UPI00078D673C|nr:polysulfide reductase [Desulfuromonas sp. DDH964]AMV72900.1 periplasmically oriented, membrane-bound formate dehydrogenase, b-type cytochrome subunit [Desulfuromonas sp. DDH964]
MKSLLTKGWSPTESVQELGSGRKGLISKLLLGLSLREYLAQAVRNPFNWILGLIFAVGLPLIASRFIFGLGSVTHSSNDYPWGLFLGFGLFAMVPLSASGFMLGTSVEIFGRHDFEPIERLALLNGLLGYFFAVVYLMVDLGQPWRLPYPMAVAFGPAAVLFLVGWHVATYLTVQVAEVSSSFFEWMGWLAGKRFIRRITLGLTVSGIILSTLHQGALGALFTYAPGKVHPLWYSSSFQWIFFLCSAIPGGLCMVIAVSTIVKKTMAWRCGEAFLASLDRLTIALAKGASMGLVTYLVIKLIGVAHDNEWAYLGTGWGQWFLFEIAFGVILPLILFARGIRYRKIGLLRLGAFVTVIGVVLNRLNTALVAFNWNLYQEIPHWKELVISITIFAIYIATYRFILYRLPILYRLKGLEALAAETAPVAEPHGIRQGAPAPSAAYRVADAE